MGKSDAPSRRQPPGITMRFCTCIFVCPLSGGRPFLRENLRRAPLDGRDLHLAAFRSVWLRLIQPLPAARLVLGAPVSLLGEPHLLPR